MGPSFVKGRTRTKENLIVTYKVFLVEDETFTREGIRDKVDWGSVGFEFCGEAPDGELALPQIEATQPDVLITDIKMPFMDGLQLSKIVHEHMPWIKIVILSGHDEFEYAQAALRIGVTEYLLKPVSSTDILDVLQRVATLLDQEESERDALRQFSSEVEHNLLLRREQFLLSLVMGGISSGEAIEQGQRLGLDLVAQQYLVLLIKIELRDESIPFDYHEYQRIEQMVSKLAGNNADILLTKKDLEELVLILKGDDVEQLRQEGQFWAELIRNEKAGDSVCRLLIEMGSPQKRLSDIHRSFAEALVKVKNSMRESLLSAAQSGKDHVELQKLDHEALENYLRFGTMHEFDSFFENHLRPICESALKSDMVMHYLFLEIVLTTAQFVSDISDGDTQIAREVQEVEKILQRVLTFGQIRSEVTQIVANALVFRNNQANHQRSMIIHQAQAYIDQHFSDPDLQMSQVAKLHNLSPNHFSTVFSQVIGEPFRDYLCNLRINHAKELLRTTNLKCSEVAYQSGFNDSHYFSTFFKKKTGASPQQFREPPKIEKE